MSRKSRSYEDDRSKGVSFIYIDDGNKTRKNKENEPSVIT